MIRIQTTSCASIIELAAVRRLPKISAPAHDRNLSEFHVKRHKDVLTETKLTVRVYGLQCVAATESRGRRVLQQHNA
jgi:hypothetical protein